MKPHFPSPTEFTGFKENFMRRLSFGSRQRYIAKGDEIKVLYQYLINLTEQFKTTVPLSMNYVNHTELKLYFQAVISDIYKAPRP